ncbi:MAG: hypothetical protein NZL92_00460 [Gloeomargarita sp. SKYG116]|nr:hypothetical protein [Gloeomargarita sp. SKYG116]MCS7291772.1 hypothetical protein [Gloeomargarita sp. SKYB120]MDW8177332.1 hypothetical protein [Gloeomargarita sp. SKYBB_i_bin120]MDW8400149.1 hypothetical protein [Gloeomargarita sp. SKYGB_i_bin116]
MVDVEELDRRLERLAQSRQASWEAVRETQSVVRAGIAHFQNHPPHWVKPKVSTPPKPPTLADRINAWLDRIPTPIWNNLPIVIGTLLGLLLADWLGAW